MGTLRVGSETVMGVPDPFLDFVEKMISVTIRVNKEVRFRVLTPNGFMELMTDTADHVSVSFALDYKALDSQALNLLVAEFMSGTVVIPGEYLQ